MTDNILQSYANQNLLDFEGGNSEFDYLIEASEELIDKITNQNIIAFAVSAINPKIPINNPQLLEVQQIIQKKWKLFVKDTKQTDIQRTILRVIILNTLDHLIDTDDKKASIIWLSCQHIFYYFIISNKNEEKIIHDILKKSGERYSLLSKANFQIVTPKFDLDNLSNFSSDTLPNSKNGEELLKELKAITNIKAPSIRLCRSNNTNHSFISPNNFLTWYNEFSTKLSGAIEDGATKERDNIKEYLITVDKKFADIFKVFKEEFPSKIQNSLHSISNNNSLIWWKETLFSESLQKSYREVSSLLQVVAMAYDLANEIDGYTPISVDFFLKETLLKIQNEDVSIKLNELAKKLSAEKDNECLTGILSENDTEKTYFYSLLDILSVRFQQKSGAAIGKALGLDGKKKLTYFQLIVWLFHDFQALKLTQNE